MWSAEALLPVEDLKPPAGFSILREVVGSDCLKATDRHTDLPLRFNIGLGTGSINPLDYTHNLEESLYMFLLRQRSVDDLVALGTHRDKANT